MIEKWVGKMADPVAEFKSIVKKTKGKAEAMNKNLMIMQTRLKQFR